MQHGSSICCQILHVCQSRPNHSIETSIIYIIKDLLHSTDSEKNLLLALLSAIAVLIESYMILDSVNKCIQFLVVDIVTDPDVIV